jgi:DNA-directed RNA polymerase specialized sigma24 family protein
MSTDNAGSVTVMIRFLRAGDREPIPALWERYFERLARLARPIVKFGTEDDAALSAIDAFCNGIAEGKFAYVDGRETLWGTLAKITERKALQQVRRWKQGVSFEDLTPGSTSGNDGAGQFAVVEPTPEYKALVNLVLAELIEALKNPLHRQAVLLLLEGYTVPEISRRLGKSREAVYVWFRAIRKIWEEHLEGRAFLD